MYTYTTTTCNTCILILLHVILMRLLYTLVHSYTPRLLSALSGATAAHRGHSTVVSPAGKMMLRRPFCVFCTATVDVLFFLRLLFLARRVSVWSIICCHICLQTYICGQSYLCAAQHSTVFAIVAAFWWQRAALWQVQRFLSERFDMHGDQLRYVKSVVKPRNPKFFLCVVLAMPPPVSTILWTYRLLPLLGCYLFCFSCLYGTLEDGQN